MPSMKIGFVLLSNSSQPMPSTRIAVLNMFPFLRAAGFEPQVLFEPAQPTETPDLTTLPDRVRRGDFRLVVFQKVHGPSVEAFVRHLSAMGTRTVYAVCDIVDLAMVAATDATVAVTAHLRSLYPLDCQSKIYVVHDGIEQPDARKTTWRMDGGSRNRPLRAILVTSDNQESLPLIDALPEWLEVMIVGRYPPRGQAGKRLRDVFWKMAAKRDARARLAYLRFLRNRRIRCFSWDPVGVYDRLRQADIGIIPIRPDDNPEGWNLKSENRLTMKMCLGLPVIATPIPSYEAVIEHGRNAFLARTQADWLT